MISSELQSHLDSGTTTLCRVWRVKRRDGLVLGFTDHDRDLAIDGLIYKADSGLTARALQQSTGLSVDNTEAVGALSDAAISEEDIAAGRWDAAEVRLWLVNWSDVAQRHELFRGSLGEVTRTGERFRAELRGLSDRLNAPVGFAYTRTCSAVLGDSRCKFDVTAPGYFTERVVEQVDTEARELRFAQFGGFADRWFEFGRLEVLDGAASGLVGVVKSDRANGTGRVIELWQGIRPPLATGDAVRLTVGCDKRPETCRSKFTNFLNFRGFPHVPGEDWLTAYPTAIGRDTSGGSRFIWGQGQ
jgi:uncharacterized phage protein (TIGR02218 family)